MTKRHANPENLSDEDLLLRVKNDNDAAERDLFRRSEGRAMAGPALDVQRILTYLRFILIDAGRLVEAELEFEAQRADKLDQMGRAWELFERQTKLGLHLPGGNGTGPHLS